ncbi:HAD hydrolase-like protein [Algoriphagus sp. D3-2-R+10]|uniref:HAD family hydrolase n=1 Tax=Algoriphagus aurantiacus TaxID=3103948 RepID=UPI002B3C386A|nr:HAD family hydrolase [Algoriphagus sp. D3-2-R+10]MEB2774351.1 HAD hydrolase-like protein [Algoriphagus sp. D3-2-R+10]
MSEKHYIKLIVFDMAGTTVNENNVVYQTLKLAINKLGHDFMLNDVLLNGGGKEKLQAIRDIMKPAYNSSEALEKDAQLAFSDFLILLKEAYENLTVSTFEGTPALFEYLRKNGVKVALNTGYNSKTALSLLGKLNWSEGLIYDALITADDVDKSRPAPDMILLAMQKCGISNPKEVAKVGDSMVDIEEGKAANCGLTFGVTTGAQTADQLNAADPDFIIDSLLELKDIIAIKD